MHVIISLLHTDDRISTLSFCKIINWLNIAHVQLKIDLPNSHMIKSKVNNIYIYIYISQIQGKIMKIIGQELWELKLSWGSVFVLNRIALSPLISPHFLGCFIFSSFFSSLCHIVSSHLLCSPLLIVSFSAFSSLSLVLTLPVYFFLFCLIFNYLITLSPLKSCLFKVSSST